MPKRQQRKLRRGPTRRGTLEEPLARNLVDVSALLQGSLPCPHCDHEVWADPEQLAAGAPLVDWVCDHGCGATGCLGSMGPGGSIPGPLPSR
jgi:hypothetical protein